VRNKRSWCRLKRAEKINRIFSAIFLIFLKPFFSPLLNTAPGGDAFSFIFHSL